MPGAGPEAEAESVTAEVLAAVAGREGVDPIDLDVPLHDVVDPDALEALFADAIDGTARGDVVVEFTYCGHRVRIDGGEVEVVETDAERPATTRE